MVCKFPLVCLYLIESPIISSTTSPRVLIQFWKTSNILLGQLYNDLSLSSRAKRTKSWMVKTHCQKLEENISKRFTGRPKKIKWLQFGQSNTGMELVLLPRVASETKIWHLMKLLATCRGKKIQPNKRTLQSFNKCLLSRQQRNCSCLCNLLVMMILTTGTDTILNRFPFATFIILMLAKGHDFIELNCNLTSALNDVCKWFKWLVLCYIVEKD